MDTIAAITHCIAGCGSRQTDKDDVPREWLQPLHPNEHQHQPQYMATHAQLPYQQGQQGQQRPEPEDVMTYVFNPPRVEDRLHFQNGCNYYAVINPNTGTTNTCTCILEKPGETHDCPAAKAAELDNVGATADRLVSLLGGVSSRSAVDADELVQRVRARIRAEVREDRPPMYRSALNAQWNPQWRQALAEAVLARMVEAVRAILPDSEAERSEAIKARDEESGEDADSPLATIVEWVRTTAPEVFQWTKDHPYLTTCIAFVAAVAVVWVLAPWVLQAAGFGELGPVAESLAARLQMRYIGYVPKGSWFAFFQRLGMVWGK